MRRLSRVLEMAMRVVDNDVVEILVVSRVTLFFRQFTHIVFSKVSHNQLQGFEGRF